MPPIIWLKQANHPHSADDYLAEALVFSNKRENCLVSSVNRDMGMCNCCAEKDQHDVTVETHPRPVEASMQSATVKEQDLRIDSEDSISSLQTALRTYQARKHFRTSDSSNVELEDFPAPSTVEEVIADFIGDPEELLSPLVRELLHSLPPFLYSRDLKGVKVRSAVRLLDGSVYVGEWQQNCRFGKGKLYNVSGGFQEGYWKGGVLHYRGRMIGVNGDVYEGSVVDGRKEGKGKLVSKENGSVYEGEWKGDKKEGMGSESFQENRSCYRGSFVAGAKQGKGIFEWGDGSRYEGEFHSDVLEGEGRYTWADHREYQGQWHNNQMHGLGRFVWPDGRVYEGHYQQDKKEGFGVYKWEGGKEYEGNWHDGKMHGEGYLSLPGKPKKKHSFVNGKRGNPLEETQ